MSGDRVPELQAQKSTPLAYNIVGAAEQFGLSRNYVRKLLATGELRHRKAGRRILVPRAALEEWLETNSRNSA